MKDITHAMAIDFNDFMLRKGSSYRLLKQEGNDWAWEINVKEDVFEAHRPMIYPNKEFYELLENHFKNNGIKLSYNNTRTVVWSLMVESERPE